MTNKMIERLSAGPKPGATIIRALFAETFAFQYDEESGGIYGVDQGGYLMTKDGLKDLIEGAEIFFSYYGDGAAEEYNAEVDQKREERRRKEEDFYKPKPPVPGYVYLLRAENGLYKIGKAKNVAKRLQPFSVHFPMKWELVHSFHSDDYGIAEEELHWQYRDKRDVGEWFKLLPEDVEHITGIQDGQL
jgi:hypothetical protein